MNTAPRNREFGPWNPGIRSQLPRDLWPLSTIFRAENAFNSADAARELAGFTGLAMEDHAALRPERLAVHELLLRITANLSVPDGAKYGELGINFRAMTAAILRRAITPRMAAIAHAHEAVRDGAAEIAARELAELSRPPPARQTARPGLLARLFRRAPTAPPAPPMDDAKRLESRLADLLRRAATDADTLEGRARAALHRIVTAIANRQGALIGDTAMIAAMVADRVGNSHGSDVIGDMIEPWIEEAAAELGYRLLPAQQSPVVLNVKGASASGKSTLRPQQRQLAGELGLDWRDLALISPDIWRKYLLDYDSLGESYKYAGTLTGHEIAIIDDKLDRYMAGKARLGAIPHLLIDRFRFDSFAVTPEEEEGGRLLTRFGATVYMFFMITPPDATVERAWKRGLQVGRYKAVDDLLDHNVEAFTGMPRLFFTWALKSDKKVHYEFLDNSVAEGARPRTVAFGWNGDMTILDIKFLLDVERYTKIDIDAKRPADVYPGDDAMAAANNAGFLRACVRQIPTVRFADFKTGRAYARMEGGEVVWTDADALAAALGDPETSAGLAALDPGLLVPSAVAAPRGAPETIDAGAARTLGQWGPDGEDRPIS